MNKFTPVFSISLLCLLAFPLYAEESKPTEPAMPATVAPTEIAPVAPTEPSPPAVSPEKKQKLCEELNTRGLPDSLIGKNSMDFPTQDGKNRCTVKIPDGRVIQDKADLDAFRKEQIKTCIEDTRIKESDIEFFLEGFKDCGL